MSGPYDDILHLPHPSSETHPRMSLEARAAQFSPFAALTGFEAAIAETGRLTDRRIELDENAIALLDEKLRLLGERIGERPEVAVTFFRPDEKKEGGAYITATGRLKKLDAVARAIVLTSGETIAITDVLEIECALFGDLI